MAIVKLSVGIDISMSFFTACLCQREQTGELIFSKTCDFSNDRTGFNQFLRWVKTISIVCPDMVFLMEATGVYYESLAHHLHKLKKTVHVVLPNTSKHYFSSLNIKTKTDNVDAKVLSQFGSERLHRIWNPPSPILRELRNLTRYYVQLQEQKTALGNIKHSKDSSYDVQAFILKSNSKLIEQIDKQILECKKAIEKLIAKDPDLKEKVRKVQTIKGLGLITIATIIAETNGFYEFNSSKQLASYAGYDIVQRDLEPQLKAKQKSLKKEIDISEMHSTFQQFSFIVCFLKQYLFLCSKF